MELWAWVVHHLSLQFCYPETKLQATPHEAVQGCHIASNQKLEVGRPLTLTLAATCHHKCCSVGMNYACSTMQTVQPFKTK